LPGSRSKPIGHGVSHKVIPCLWIAWIKKD
jgi:hypothetical protein